MRDDQMEGRRPCRVVAALAGALAGVLMLTEIASAERGYTTWYGPGFHGKVMASGRVFDENDPTTTASNQFPFGTWLRVTNPNNGRIVYVQVRDRGAFAHALDLSRAAYFQLDPPNPWGFWVDYEVVPGPGEAPRAAATQPSSRGAAAHAPLRLVPRLAAASAPSPSAASAPRPSAARPTPAPTPIPTHRPAAEHVVAVGETLSSIARLHRLPVAPLIAWNGLDHPDALVVGQTLRLTAPTRRYVVQPGDTLNGIAEALGVPLAAILERNAIDNPDALVVGQELVVLN
jgi:rare lipoprotein A (peptidoglycan hydrolase)